MVFIYPHVKRDETVVDDYHGVKIADPYRWLENPDSEETKAFVAAQNEITRPYLDSSPTRQSLREELTTLWNFPKSYVPSKHGAKYYQHRNSGLQNQNVIYVQESIGSEACVFLDPNTFSDDGTAALSGMKFTEDGAVLAYGISYRGSDWVEIRFKHAATGKEYDEILKKIKFTSMSWLHDNKGFFYSGFLDQNSESDGSETDANLNHKLYFHTLNTPQCEDIPVVAFDDPQLRVQGEVSHCGKYLIVTAAAECKNNLVFFAELTNKVNPNDYLDLKPFVSVLEADYEYITNNNQTFFFRTDKGAPNYKIISVNFDNLSENSWITVVPEHPKDVLEICKPINNNKIVLVYLRDVKSTMELRDLESGKKIKNFELEMGTITSLSGKREDTELFFGFTSFTVPFKVYRIDFTSTDIKAVQIQESKAGDLNPDDYIIKQLFYKSKDNTSIPMYIIHKKNFVQNGSRPCLLYGYGGFNASLTPSFSVSRLLFASKFDGIFAVANIRGGGEYGEKWHTEGKLENKQNCFDDFKSAANYLSIEKYTNPRKLIIQGGSNGGLLVAACINQAPELFAVAICQVGVLDMLRFHKFTIGYAWKSDYGCSDKAEQFEWLIKYSPLHNVQPPQGDNEYPATLILTADHDDRVVPLHSLKFAAELQYRIGSLPQQQNPLMIRIDTKAGHGAGKPTTKLIEEVVDIYSFIGNSLNFAQVKTNT